MLAPTISLTCHADIVQAFSLHREIDFYTLQHVSNYSANTPFEINQFDLHFQIHRTSATWMDKDGCFPLTREAAHAT